MFALFPSLILLTSSYQCSESVVLPEGTTEINESAFEGCTMLVSVSFPSTLEKISKKAFYGCFN